MLPFSVNSGMWHVKSLSRSLVHRQTWRLTAFYSQQKNSNDLRRFCNTGLEGALAALTATMLPNYGRYQGCGAVTFLVGSGSGSGSGSREAFRLRLRVKLFGGSGSGSGSDDQVLIWALTSNTSLKNGKWQHMTSYWLGREFECDFEWVSFNFVTHCHPRPLTDIGEVTDSFGLRCLRLMA